MSIKQFNATYLANDDRLLFRFNTTEDTEFRFWFTRRVTLFILAATQHLTVKKLEKIHSSDVAKAMAEFGDDVMKVDPSSQGVSRVEAYEPASKYPLGADALLVMDAKCTPEKQGAEEGVSLDLVLPGGANINVKLAGPTLRALCALLNQLREHASWGEVPQVQEVATTGQTSNEAKKPLMH